MDHKLWSIIMNLFFVAQVYNCGSKSQFHAFRLGSFCRKNPIKNWCTKVDQTQWSSIVDFYQICEILWKTKDVKTNFKIVNDN